MSAVVFAALCSCATSSHIVTGKVRPPIPVDQVQVYAAAPLGAQEVAILTVESSGWTTQGEQDLAVARLKKEAAALGANGVLIARAGTESSGVVGNINPQTGALWAASSTYTSIRATAIFVAEKR
jgi:uncharacterized protein YbjQ (UPF0145 family)